MTEFDNINFEEILDEGFGIAAEEINRDELGNQEADKTQFSPFFLLIFWISNWRKAFISAA